MCHIAQEFMLLGSLQHGSCTIQPSKIMFSPDELVDMIVRCRLNRLNQFAAYLATNIRAARQIPKLLSLLQNLDEIAYSGLALPQDEETWAYSQGLQLKVRKPHNYCPVSLTLVFYRMSSVAQKLVQCFFPSVPKHAIQLPFAPSKVPRTGSFLWRNQDLAKMLTILQGECWNLSFLQNPLIVQTLPYAIQTAISTPVTFFKKFSLGSIFHVVVTMTGSKATTVSDATPSPSKRMCAKHADNLSSNALLWAMDAPLPPFLLSPQSTWTTQNSKRISLDALDNSILADTSTSESPRPISLSSSHQTVYLALRPRATSGAGPSKKHTKLS